MKKTMLMLAGASLLVLTACGTETKIEENLNNNITEKNTEKNDDILASTPIDQMTCNQTVQDYLNSSDKVGTGAEVKNGNQIVVDYIGRLADGSVFDTSVESVAKGCGSYQSGRDYTSGLEFEVGAGQMIAGFDSGVVSMKVGQTKTIEIPAKDAYGDYSQENVVTYPISDVPNPDDYTEGMKFYAYGNMPVTVLKKTDSEITLDFNHELAGKDLIFDITIKEIK